MSDMAASGPQLAFVVVRHLGQKGRASSPPFRSRPAIHFAYARGAISPSI